MPIKHQDVFVKVNHTVAVIDFIQTYFNNTDSPLEVLLNFPIDSEYTLTKVNAVIGGQVIEG